MPTDPSDLSEAFWAGFDAGAENERNRQAYHEAERAILRSAAEPAVRLRDADGRQILTCGRYSYINPGEDLAVGDLVRLPGNWLFPRPRTAEITSLGTDYDGALDLILGRPDPAARNSWEPDPGWPQAVREAYAARASEANTG